MNASHFVTERPEGLEQLTARSQPEALALTACLHGLRIACQVGTTPATGGPEGWWCVWVSAAKLRVANMVLRGFDAGLSAHNMDVRKFNGA